MILAAITTHKRPPWMVERALKSVIAQTYTDWNLVVVDDSPPDYELRDDVRKMVEGYSRNDSRIRYVAHDRNYGVSHARNTALGIATSEGHEFIAYLDDDDEWLPKKLEKQLAKFQECGDGVALVYCDCTSITEDGASKRLGYTQISAEDGFYARLLKGNFIAICALVRTECLNGEGGFDERLSALEDYDAWLRLSLKYDFAFVDESLLNVYDHSGSHVNFDMRNTISAFNLIYTKHKDYLQSHPDIHWPYVRLVMTIQTRHGDLVGFFGKFIDAVKVQPSKIFICLRMLFHFFSFNLRKKLKEHCPRFFNALKTMKHKLTGKRDVIV